MLMEGIAGNERVDTLAKGGAREEQTNNTMTYQERKTIIKSLHKPLKAHGTYCKLDRREQVMIFRLRTGHNRLNFHMHRLRLVKSPKCPCGTADQIAEHVLNHCPALHDRRKANWPQHTPLHQKLHVSLTDLRNTVNFMADSELEV